MSTSVVAYTSSDPAERRLGVAAVLVATLFWSFGGVLAKATDAEGIVVTFWRMWMATVVMIVIAGVRREWPSWFDLRRCLVPGVLFGANIAVFFTALERISVANALVIAALAPVLMLPIAVKMLGERLTPTKVMCAVVAVLGVVVAIQVAPSNGASSSDQLIGYLLAFGGLFLWLGYLVTAKQARRDVDTIPFMFAVSAIGAVAISIAVVITRPPLGQVQGEGWLWIVLLTLGPGLAGHGLVAWAQSRVDASVSTVLMQGEPVGATILAYFLLDEDVSAGQMMAMAIVIVALSVLAYSEAREAKIYVEPAPG